MPRVRIKVTVSLDLGLLFWLGLWVTVCVVVRFMV